MRRRGNKYGAVKTEVDGKVFHSKGEARRYQELKCLEKIGDISNLETQVDFPIEVDGLKVFKYIADFTYMQDELFTIEDFKGVLTDVFKLKWKLVKHLYRNLNDGKVQFLVTKAR